MTPRDSLTHRGRVPRSLVVLAASLFLAGPSLDACASPLTIAEERDGALSEAGTADDAVAIDRDAIGTDPDVTAFVDVAADDTGAGFDGPIFSPPFDASDGSDD